MANVTNNYNLQIKKPSLSKEWHPTKNKHLTPLDVPPKSKKKVWWVCNKGHEWKAQISHRNNGSGCPYCAMKKSGEDNNLAVLNPSLAKEWHPIKNKDLTPYDVVPGSNKKVWWMCKKGHEWKTKIFHRNRGSGCPFCAGKKAGEDNNLSMLNPNLAKEWHPIKNKDLTPYDVVPGSNKKVWWMCKKGHEFSAVINSRHRGKYKCPYCSGKKAGRDNNLAVLNPSLAKEWHPTKNKNLTPFDFTLGSKTKVWWMCKKGHKWKADIGGRNRGRGCPYCSGNIVGEDNNLAVLNPSLAKEWHPIKNKDLTPYDVVPGSNKKVWWICKKGHEWRAGIKYRNRGSGCPICRTGYSKLELRIYCELKTIFDRIKLRDKVQGIECDVLIPDKKVAIEIDGFPWHNGLEDRDRKKTKTLSKLGIKVYRVRDKKLKMLSEEDLFYKDAKISDQKKTIKNIINLLDSNGHLNEDEKTKVEKYFIDSKFKNTKEYKRILSTLPGPPPGESFFDLYPEKAKCWDYTKNYPLIPQLFSPYSQQKVWWKCDQGHELEQPITSRTGALGNGCRICSNKDMGEIMSLLSAEISGSLGDKHKELISEWHSIKNGDRTPYNVSVYSGFVAWWICKKGHEWKASVGNRTAQRTGCPYCSNRRVCDDNHLEKLYPNLAEEWHPKMNRNLKPNEVVPGTPKKVWWLCSKGHKYKMQVRYRAKFGHNCPYCSGKRVCEDNNLEILFPEIAKQWHPTKNGNKKPSDYTRGSGVYVWWICENGHEWRTKIQHRTISKSGCPVCSRKR
jgi:hypothetical protein